AFCFGDSWCDLDLVTLNADLGEYFGTREGLLVVKAPADSALPLKGGDVILSIGGRKPTSPAHAMRILRSYDAGEAVSIEIMRHERRQTLSWKVPEASERNWQRTPRGWSRERGQPSFWMAPRPGSRMKVRVSAI
ncbi:MAG: PDZ domain-containing protein, partial [Gemmatimonadales bacterium]